MTTENVADYRVLTDGFTELALARDLDEDFDFNLPNNLHREGRAVVSWMDRKDGPGDTVRYTMKMNGSNIRPARPTYVAMPNLTYSRQEVIPADLLRKGRNTLKIEVTGGDGQLEISDIAVTFKKSIDV